MTCTADGCDDPIEAKRLCHVHRLRAWRLERSREAREQAAANAVKTRVCQQMYDDGLLLAACTQRLDAVWLDAERNKAEILASEGLTESQLKVSVLLVA